MMDRKHRLQALFWKHAAGPMSFGSFTTLGIISGFPIDFILTDIVDVPLLKVAIIIDDGDPLEERHIERDLSTWRDRSLMKAGWQVITFTSRQIQVDCLGCVAEALELVEVWSGGYIAKGLRNNEIRY